MTRLDDGLFRIPEWLLSGDTFLSSIGTFLSSRDFNTQRTRQPNLKMIINSLADLAHIPLGCLALQVKEAAKRLFF